jgi:hypothetical protein
MYNAPDLKGVLDLARFSIHDAQHLLGCNSESGACQLKSDSVDRRVDFDRALDQSSGDSDDPDDAIPAAGDNTLASIV